MQNIADHNILNMVLYCLLDEINGPTASLENARDFLFQKKLLKSSKLLNRTIILLTYNYYYVHSYLPLCLATLQTGPRTSWQNANWSADQSVGKTQTGPRTSQLAKRKLVRGPGSGFLDTAGPAR